jgi:hypothetical protein
MRPLPESSRAIIDQWVPELGMRARGLSLGWAGPYDPAEFALLSWNCAEQSQYLGNTEQTPAENPLASREVEFPPEQVAAAAEFDALISKAEDRVAETFAQWADSVESARRRQIAQNTVGNGSYQQAVFILGQSDYEKDVRRDHERAMAELNRLQMSRDACLHFPAASAENAEPTRRSGFLRRSREV